MSLDFPRFARHFFGYILSPDVLPSVPRDNRLEVNLRARFGVNACDKLETFQNLENVLPKKLADIPFAVTINIDPAVLVDTL